MKRPKRCELCDEPLPKRCLVLNAPICESQVTRHAWICRPCGERWEHSFNAAWEKLKSELRGPGTATYIAMGSGALTLCAGRLEWQGKRVACLTFSDMVITDDVEGEQIMIPANSTAIVVPTKKCAEVFLKAVKEVGYIAEELADDSE